ncbi:MAG: DUF4214 domain-containing protein [Methylocystis sp.]
MTAFSAFTSINIPAPVGNNVYISATGVDAAGEVVGYYGSVDGEGDSTDYAFVATGGIATTYNISGASNIIGIGVTSSGEIWGSYTDNYNRDYGFVVINGALDEFNVPAATATYVTGVTDGGVIYGYFNNGSNQLQGYVYHFGYSFINVPGATTTTVSGVNASGEIVGVFTDAAYAAHGFTDFNGAYAAFSVPGATETYVVGVSDAGVIAGSYVDASNNEHVFTYNNGAITTINVAGSNYASATAENAAGEIVGYYEDNAGNIHGFIDNNGVVSTVDVPGATETDIVGVNGAGVISGYYNDASGVQHGFVGQIALSTGGVTGATDSGAATVGAGHVIAVTLDTTAGVTVTGTPTLQLSDNQVATYASGSGTDALTFYYVVQPGDNTSDLHVTGLNLPNGATIQDTLGNNLSTNVTADLGIAINANTTPPATSVQQEVLGLYAALYNRAADSPGLAYWESEVGATMATGASTTISTANAELLGQMFVTTQSTYFNATYGALNDSQFISALYTNIGGNAGDPGGITYWTGQLAMLEAQGASVQTARSEVVGAFVQEFIEYDLSTQPSTLTTAQYQAAVQRQTVFDNKLAVSEMYASFSTQSGGTILDAQTTTDAAFAAATRAIQNVTTDPTTAEIAIAHIQAAVANNNLAFI